MPFVTACTFCPYRATVPDRATGACVRCPKCGNCFTVAPLELVPAKAPTRPVASPKRVSTKRVPPSVPQVSPVAVAVVSPEPPPPPSESSLPERINPWGVSAFSLAALAMLLGVFALPRWLALCFVGLGLLLGLIGLAMPREKWKLKDAIWLALGGGSCGILLFIVLLRPGWMSERWTRSFKAPAPAAEKQILVSRSNPSEVKELRGNDRVDAATYAIRQGDILVRIERADVKQVTPNGPPVLLIVLHIANVGPLRLITYHGQAGGQHGAVARDSRGVELRRHDLDAESKKRDQIDTAIILPLHEVTDLLALGAPWPGSAGVEVDLPSAAWGTEGVCRFTIPSAFIVRGK